MFDVMVIDVFDCCTKDFCIIPELQRADLSLQPRMDERQEERSQISAHPQADDAGAAVSGAGS